MNAFVLILGLIPLISSAQSEDSLKTYSSDAVVVSTYKDEEVKKTTLNIQPINVDSLSLMGYYTLTDLIASQPGVQMLSTGNGVSKPVIRGLSGNRVLVLLSGT